MVKLSIHPLQAGRKSRRAAPSGKKAAYSDDQSIEVFRLEVGG